jgi:hypothetical protein
MAAPHDAKLVRIRVSNTVGGTYTNVGYVRSVDIDRGTEGDTTLRWFGGEAAKAGDLTLGGTIPVFWDDEDTTGQTILEAAYMSGDAVYLQFAPHGTGAGKKVKQFEAVITEAPISADSEGEAVEGSFGFRGTPSTWTTITLA